VRPVQNLPAIFGSETVDLGIKGRRAIVCASSKGLGRACAISLAEAGVHVTLTARAAPKP
jgi:NAD(P)-dependent dehydrogenase (short-subunit alcohol dehydrogenase family)